MLLFASHLVICTSRHYFQASVSSFVSLRELPALQHVIVRTPGPNAMPHLSHAGWLDASRECSRLGPAHVSSSPSRRSLSPLQPGELAFQFWAATLAPPSAPPLEQVWFLHGLACGPPPQVCPSYVEPCSLQPHLALWPLLRCADALTAPFHPCCTLRDFLTSLFVFLTGSCDRRQIMSTKARETKKPHQAARKRLRIKEPLRSSSFCLMQAPRKILSL